MSNRLLKQEEIDALLNAKIPEPAQDEADDAGDAVDTDNEEGQNQENDTGIDFSQAEGLQDVNNPVLTEAPSETGQEVLSEAEKDALGEIGNICMGSASTTLSMLLSQKVSITSPRVTIATLDELARSFDIPHMTIFVHFIEGLSGFNLLIIKLQDAAVLADLMMGGDGTNITEDLPDISVSAASEAMNQMIGSASTALATMFNRTVNISPPVTRVYKSSDELNPSDLGEEGPVVVVWFKMTIGSILDTQIMQVMSIDTAREEAGLILSQISDPDEVELPAGVEEENLGEETPGHSSSETVQEFINGDVVQEFSKFDGTEHENLETEAPAPFRASKPVELPTADRRTLTVGASPSEQAKPVSMVNGFDQQRLNMILDIPLKVTVLLGRTKWPIKDILGLTPGSVAEMQSLVDEPVEVLVNGTLVATGEVVVVNENFGVRITNIIGAEERLQNLGR